MYAGLKLGWRNFLIGALVGMLTFTSVNAQTEAELQEYTNLFLRLDGQTNRTPLDQRIEAGEGLANLALVLFGISDSRTYNAWGRLATKYQLNHEPEKAEYYYRQAVQGFRDGSEPASVNVARFFGFFASLLMISERPDEAEQFYLEALGFSEATFADAGAFRLALLQMYMESERYVDLEPVLRDAMEISLLYLGPEDPSYGSNVAALAHVLAKMGRNDEAIELLHETLNALPLDVDSEALIIKWLRRELDSILGGRPTTD
ncbi:MAG: hypothetical protein JKY31_08370 [Rhodobacteraceae bacterium]|nr:hypothetical protein [Paracoccaceae bacterium]